MYRKFFGFTHKPFEVTPNPRFLFLTPAYQEVLSALLYGVHERSGVIAIVGEVGTGKTLMLKAMMERLDYKTKVAFISNSDLTFKQMLIMALWELEVIDLKESLSKEQAIQHLNIFAIEKRKEGGNVVLVVDEAQNINYRTMENLRMLSNLETRTSKLVQIILSGQPELDEKLSLPEWRQLVQRISLKRYATALDEENTYEYVHYRLNIAEYRGDSLFTQAALKAIWKYTCGIPRKINILCDNGLLIGYGLGQKQIDVAIIEEAAKDLCWTALIENHYGKLESADEIIDTSEKIDVTSDVDESIVSYSRHHKDKKVIEGKANKQKSVRVVFKAFNYVFGIGMILIIILLSVFYL